MIKPIMSSPVVRKFALGAMMAGAVAGMSSCSSKPNDVSFEHNEHLINRITENYKPGWFSDETVVKEARELMSTHGLYAGTMIAQRRLDQRTLSHSDFYGRMLDIAQREHEKYLYDMNDKISYKKQVWTYPYQVRKQWGEYMDFAESGDKHMLMRSGGNTTPTYEECIQYIDDAYTGVVDKDVTKIAKYIYECNKFKESLGRMDDKKMAELIAFKQFKLDSVAFALPLNKYKDGYFLRDDTLQNMYKYTYFPKIAKPKAESSSWNNILQKIKSFFK